MLKKKMAGGLTRTEEMLSTEDESHNHGARPSPSCSKRRAPAKLKRRVTIPRVPTHTSTSTPRTLKRPALTSPKGPKTLLHKRKTNSRKNAKGSGVVTETPSEPAVVTHELAVDDVEGMLFVSFANKVMTGNSVSETFETCRAVQHFSHLSLHGFFCTFRFLNILFFTVFHQMFLFFSSTVTSAQYCM